MNIIVAMDSNYGIGKEGKLPWKLKPDLERFRDLTTGKIVVMGRKTYESIGKPLPHRTNIIITSQQNFIAKDCIIYNSVGKALEKLSVAPNVFCIGGAEIYKQFLPHVDTIYFTKISGDFKADTFFPEIDTTEWPDYEQDDCRQDPESNLVYQFGILYRARTK